MMNNELLEKITALSAEVTALESEAKRTSDTVNGEIAVARAEKEVKIVEFLHSLEETFKVGGFPRGKEYECLCCGTHWEGKPHACGSHERSIGLSFRATYEGYIVIQFGRYFLGNGSIDHILTVGTEKLIRANNLTDYGFRISGELRENIIDRWTVETERMLADWMVNLVTEHLKVRLGKATQTIKGANDKREEYFGKEGC